MQFPKITVCLNSMHSMERIRELFPIMASHINTYYGEDMDKFLQNTTQETVEKLQEINMLHFYMKVGSILINFCFILLFILPFFCTFFHII